LPPFRWKAPARPKRLAVGRVVVVLRAARTHGDRPHVLELARARGIIERCEPPSSACPVDGPSDRPLVLPTRRVSLAVEDKPFAVAGRSDDIPRAKAEIGALVHANVDDVHADDVCTRYAALRVSGD